MKSRHLAHVFIEKVIPSKAVYNPELLVKMLTFPFILNKNKSIFLNFPSHKKSNKKLEII